MNDGRRTTGGDYSEERKEGNEGTGERKGLALSFGRERFSYTSFE